MTNKLRLLCKNGFTIDIDKFRRASDKALAGNNLSTKEKDLIVDTYSDLITRICEDTNLYNATTKNYKNNPAEGKEK